MSPLSHTEPLPSDTMAAREARRRVVQLLADRCPLTTVETAALLTSELVTNAVVHGAPPVELRVELAEQVVRVEVHDGADDPPVLRQAGPSDAGGRGLAIVDALASRWGAQRRDEGKALWFELPAGLR